jgi:phosphoribosylamine--glycine ligase
MGDPETQPIMMRLKSDLVEVMLAATSEKLDTVELDSITDTGKGIEEDRVQYMFVLFGELKKR